MREKEVKISTILTLLEEGKTRKEIAELLEITQTQCKNLFKHPKLKNKRKKSEPQVIELIDDTNIERDWNLGTKLENWEEVTI